MAGARRNRWYERDRGLTARMALALALVALVDAAALTLLALIGVPAWLVIAVGVAFLAGQILLGPPIALALFRARRVGPEDEPELHALIERLCQLADLGKPRIAVAEIETPTAFAVGRSERSATICVTRGLLDALEPDELAGALAHELSHVASRDAVVMSIASLVPTVAGMGVRLAFWDGIPDAFDEAATDGSVRWDVMMIGGAVSLAIAFGMVILRLLLIVPVGVGILLYGLTLPAVAALSRHRELAADRAAAMLTGSPAALASALARLSGAMDEIPRRDLRRVALANALLVMPAGSSVPGLARLTATHPPVEERVRRLMALAGPPAT